MTCRILLAQSGKSIFGGRKPWKLFTQVCTVYTGLPSEVKSKSTVNPSFFSHEQKQQNRHINRHQDPNFPRNGLFGKTQRLYKVEINLIKVNKHFNELSRFVLLNYFSHFVDLWSICVLPKRNVFFIANYLQVEYISKRTMKVGVLILSQMMAQIYNFLESLNGPSS
jgi:hypothetical protein